MARARRSAVDREPCPRISAEPLCDLLDELAARGRRPETFGLHVRQAFTIRHQMRGGRIALDVADRVLVRIGRPGLLREWSLWALEAERAALDVGAIYDPRGRDLVAPALRGAIALRSLYFAADGELLLPPAEEVVEPRRCRREPVAA